MSTTPYSVPSSDALPPTPDTFPPSYIKKFMTSVRGNFLKWVKSLDTKTHRISLSRKKYSLIDEILGGDNISKATNVGGNASDDGMSLSILKDIFKDIL